VQQRHPDGEPSRGGIITNPVLMGVSGISGDMRQVLGRVRAGHPQAQLAWRSTHAGSAGDWTTGWLTMGGVDALVFTDGVGEHAGQVRETIVPAAKSTGVGVEPRPIAHLPARVQT